MLNRRHIRIKVMQNIFAHIGGESNDVIKDQKFLFYSLNTTYDLYLAMQALLIELYNKSKKHNEKLQNQVSNQAVYAYAKLEDNLPLKQIANNPEVINAINEKKLNFWDLDFEYIDSIFKTILKSDIHKAHLVNESYKADRNFLITIFTEFIAPNDKLFDYFEDKNITWVDDIPVVNTLVLKQLRKIKASTPFDYFLPELYKDDDDRIFAKDLYTKTVLNQSKFTDIITQKAKNWDTDRLATIDNVILKMAICEFQNFSSIPYKVTINEYLEIAKEYSTPKSSIFINGILDKIAKEYKDNNSYPKMGRGLL